MQGDGGFCRCQSAAYRAFECGRVGPIHIVTASQ